MTPIHELNTISFPLSSWTNASQEIQLGICSAYTMGVKFLELSTVVRNLVCPYHEEYF